MTLLNKRQKVLLSVIDTLERHGKNTKTFIMKALFLIKQDFRADEKIRFYSFFPYKYGPFSEAVYSDLNYLVKQGFVEETQTSLTPEGRVICSSNNLFKEQSESIALRYSNQHSILDDTYKRYPTFTVNSELVRKPETKKVPAILATGYEGEDIDEFLNKLIKNQIDTVIDIRNNPFSMKFSFTKSRLVKHLQKVGIRYVHIKELGVEKEFREKLETSEDYSRLFLAYKEKLVENRDKVLELLKLSDNHRIALLCFEKNPQQCHRSALAEELKDKGKQVIFV